MKRAIMFPKGAVEAAIKAYQNRRADMGNEYDNEKFFEEYATAKAFVSSSPGEKGSRFGVRLWLAL